jgi:tripartite-type tricarboxylate transporter receptor subunit TctC
MAMLQSSASVKGSVIPYTGAAPLFTDMLAGNVDATVATPPFPEGLKVLASVSSRRSPAYPNVPTLEEYGIQNASFDLWYGFVAPPNLPKPIANRLIAEIGAVLADPEAIARYQSAAKTLPETNPLIGDAFRNRVVEEQMNWKTVATREKIVVQQ